MSQRVLLTDAVGSKNLRYGFQSNQVVLFCFHFFSFAVQYLRELIVGVIVVIQPLFPTCVQFGPYSNDPADGRKPAIVDVEKIPFFHRVSYIIAGGWPDFFH